MCNRCATAEDKPRCPTIVFVLVPVPYYRGILSPALLYSLTNRGFVSSVVCLLFRYRIVSNLRKHLWSAPALRPYNTDSTFPFGPKCSKSIEIHMLFGSEGTKPKDYVFSRFPQDTPLCLPFLGGLLKGKKMRFCWYSCSIEMGFKLCIDF